MYLGEESVAAEYQGRGDHANGMIRHDVDLEEGPNGSDRMEFVVPADLIDRLDDMTVNRTWIPKREETSDLVALDDDLTVTIAAVRPWGYAVHLPDGTEGLIAQAKVPSWAGTGPPPAVGDTVLVTVLDDTRSPVRLSALPKDIEIARSLRQNRQS